jgi:hypothetical protein
MSSGMSGGMLIEMARGRNVPGPCIFHSRSSEGRVQVYVDKPGPNEATWLTSIAGFVPVTGKCGSNQIRELAPTNVGIVINEAEPRRNP